MKMTRSGRPSPVAKAGSWVMPGQAACDGGLYIRSAVMVPVAVAGVDRVAAVAEATALIVASKGMPLPVRYLPTMYGRKLPAPELVSAADVLVVPVPGRCSSTMGA